jgi:hypothetical protein
MCSVTFTYEEHLESPKEREREREAFFISFLFGVLSNGKTIPNQKDGRYIVSLNELPDLHRIMTDHGASGCKLRLPQTEGGLNQTPAIKSALFNAKEAKKPGRWKDEIYASM